MAIKTVGGLLAGIFTWLQLKDFPFIPLLESAPPEALLKFVIATYYFSWVFGTSFDVKLQQSVYVSDPSRGRLTWAGVVALVVLAVIAAILLWVSDSTKEFAAVLNVFVLADLLTWRYHLIPRTSPIIRASKNIYLQDKEYFDVERLRIVEDYIVGKWHWRRFIVLGGVLLMINLLCFVDPVSKFIGGFSELMVPALKAGLAESLLPVLAIIVFVTAAEGWKWMLRMRIRITLHVMSDLKKKYRPTLLRENPTPESP